MKTNLIEIIINTMVIFKNFIHDIYFSNVNDLHSYANFERKEFEAGNNKWRHFGRSYRLERRRNVHLVI